jgi:hypothetical protein
VYIIIYDFISVIIIKYIIIELDQGLVDHASSPSYLEDCNWNNYSSSPDPEKNPVRSHVKGGKGKHIDMCPSSQQHWEF